MAERLCVEGLVKVRVGPSGRSTRMHCCSAPAEPRVLEFRRAPHAWRHGVPPGVDVRAGRVRQTLDLRTMHTFDFVECVDARWAIGDACTRAEFVLREAGGRVWAITVDGRDAVRTWRRILPRLLAAGNVVVPAPAAPPSPDHTLEDVSCANVRSRATSVAIAETTTAETTVPETRPRAQTLDVQRIMAVLDTLIPRAAPHPSPGSSVPTAPCDTEDVCGEETLDVRDECLPPPPEVPAIAAVVHADACTPCTAAVQRIVHAPMMAVLPPLFPLPSLPPIMSAPANSPCFSPPSTAPTSPVVILPPL